MSIHITDDLTCETCGSAKCVHRGYYHNTTCEAWKSSNELTGWNIVVIGLTLLIGLALTIALPVMLEAR